MLWALWWTKANKINRNVYHCSHSVSLKSYSNGQLVDAHKPHVSSGAETFLPAHMTSLCSVLCVYLLDTQSRYCLGLGFWRKICLCNGVFRRAASRPILIRLVHSVWAPNQLLIHPLTFVSVCRCGAHIA